MANLFFKGIRFFYKTADSLQKNLRNQMSVIRLIKKINHPIVYFDIGARYGTNNLIRKLAKKNLIKVYGFEPDKEECDRLNKAQNECTYFPYAIGAKKEKRPFYITNHPGASSFLKPNEELLKPYPIRSCFEISKIIEIESISLDELIEQKKIPVPQVLKIDTQGFELEVLKGISKNIHKVECIHLESHLEPLYEKQSLFYEIKEYLSQKGMDLAGIRGTGAFEGKILELECCFCRPPDSFERKVLRAILKRISGEDLMESMADLAHEKYWEKYLNYVNKIDIEHSRIIREC